MVEMGRITRLSVDEYTEKKKLYCVNLISPFKDPPDTLKDIIDRYWREVEAQLQRLEFAGKIKKIFCESIYIGGGDGLEILSKFNPHAYQIVKKKVEEGAELLPLEDIQLYTVYIDWRNCLGIVQTHDVYEKVLEHFKQSRSRRLDHIQKVLQENLRPSEAALLLMTDEDRAKLQLSPDIEVFLVTPPSYDDLLRWFRDNVLKSGSS